MTFEKYARIIDNLLQNHWAIEKTQVTAEMFTPKHGKISGKIILLDESFIDFSERITIIGNKVAKVRYRFQYVKSKEDVFRYDNFPRHPGIHPPYHHKHFSDQQIIQLEEPPKLIDVIEEAIRYMF